jgi:hypothetical protein
VWYSNCTERGRILKGRGGRTGGRQEIKKGKGKKERNARNERRISRPFYFVASSCMCMRVFALSREYDGMQESLISGALAPSDYGKVSKQLSDATKVLDVASVLDNKINERDDLKELIKSGGKSEDEIELVEMAREELQACVVEIDAMEESIKMMLLPKGTCLSSRERACVCVCGWVGGGGGGVGVCL